MRFEWDEVKNQSNFRKHHVRFETALLVFGDPYAITLRDQFFDEEERWITLGAVGLGSVLVILHTQSEIQDEEVIRIISARFAEPDERKTYEETHKDSEERYTRTRRSKRRRH
jgi:hypothetical protein